MLSGMFSDMVDVLNGREMCVLGGLFMVGRLDARGSGTTVS